MKNNTSASYFVNNEGRLIFTSTATGKKTIVSEEEAKTLIIQRMLIRTSRNRSFSKKLKRWGIASLDEYAKRLETNPIVINYAKELVLKLNALV